MRLRRFPLKGAHPVAWQSQFHGCTGGGTRVSRGVFDHPEYPSGLWIWVWRAWMTCVGVRGGEGYSLPTR